jgi:hypothetical protein
MRIIAKRQIEELIQLRKQLADIETKRRLYPENTPQEIYQELMVVIQHLEKAEEQVRQTSKSIMENVNKIRSQILKTLDKYNLLCDKMAQFEELFLINIIRPGNSLRQATLQKDYLEQEYERIQSAIEKEEYACREDLEADIQFVLLNRETIGNETITKTDKDQREKEELLKRLDEIDVDDVIDAIRIDKIITEFKTIVLPAVHPDTSETPDDVFEVVFDVYEKTDILLMESYLVKYRGEVKSDPGSDPINNLEGLLNTEKHYMQVFSQLNERFARLKLDVTTQEVKNPEDVQAKMQQQRIEILKRIQDEAEKINFWREKIENLQ